MRAPQGCFQSLKLALLRYGIRSVRCYLNGLSSRTSHTNAFALLAKFALRTKARFTQVRFPHLARAQRFGVKNAPEGLTSHVAIAHQAQRLLCYCSHPFAFSFSSKSVGLRLEFQRFSTHLCFLVFA